MWTDRDRGLALAYEVLLKQDCSGCGQPLTESTDPANQRSYVAESIVCFACEAMQREQDIAQEEARNGGGRSFGVKWLVGWRGGD